MEKQISIIIPTYNMEAYIGKCLDSLIIPEFDAVEVLVVNDGSKDRSSEIAHSYAERYPASIRVIDKPNGNYGSCINAALPLATGRYVKILDADDTFDTDAFSRLLRLLPGISADAIITSYVTVDDMGQVLEKMEIDKWGVTNDKELVIDEAWPVIGKRFVQMHMLAYKRDVFSRFHYVQSEGISYTDTEWAIIPLCRCMSVYCTNLYVYRYLIGRQGQTMQPEKMMKGFDNLIKVISSINTHIKDCKSTSIRERLFQKSLNHHIYTYSLGLGYNSDGIMELIKQYDNVLKTDIPELYMAIGDYKILAHSNYNHFTRLRNEGYPCSLNIPLRNRLRSSVISRIKRFI